VIEFRVLGPLQVVKQGRSLPLGGIKQRGLLALLLLDRNRVVPRDRLVDALWGERPPRSAANSVHVYVSKLRRLFENGEPGQESALVTEPPGYLLRVPVGALDTDEFERLLVDGKGALSAGAFAEAESTLARALAIWRGPALADLARELYAQAEIARLEGLRLQALEARFAAMLAGGRQAEVVGELQALLGVHPLDERLRAQLMVALYRSGRPAESLETYRAFRRLLSEELGLEPSPELRQLEQAILRQDASLGQGAPLASPVAAVTHSADETRRASASRPFEDELRPVTVLFADIVGSTALGERLPPDEAKALMGECVTMMSRAVEEYGGMVQAYAGDGICAYFGVPTAHADDPERAARAGLRILEVVHGYAQSIAAAWDLESFSVRVGINTGQAAVGHVGAATPGAVALGDATNVAARLEGLAAPGTILVGEATVRRLVHRFAFEPVGELAVKGREDTVAASRLVGPKAREPDAIQAPLVGRDQELTQLTAALDELVSGRGRIVLVSGEPGIGKTRLLAELRSLAGERVTWLEGRCHSYGGVSGWPFVEAFLGWLGADIGEPEIALRTKARAKLGALFPGGAGEVLPLLGRFLRLRIDEPTGAEAPGAVHDAYVRWVEALAADQPVIVAIEDLQWADRQTRELAEALFELAERAPVTLLFTQETAPGSEGAALRLRALGEYGHRTNELSLGPLSDGAADQLLAGVLGNAADAATRMRVIREAEGNPLYLEELARAMLEGALAPRGRTWTVSVRSELLPPALENLLVARIDRLPDGARRLAQVAAAIGRTFPVPVLEAVAGRDVGAELGTLFRAEIVRELRRYPELECTFTHGLLHDAARSTLTAARKRELYSRVASAFESVYADSLDDHLERLAHYHAQSGNLPRALEYAERARAGLTLDRAEDSGRP
jgi:DNA-binding SARP family transcriptional activator